MTIRKLIEMRKQKPEYFDSTLLWQTELVSIYLDEPVDDLVKWKLSDLLDKWKELNYELSADFKPTEVKVSGLVLHKMDFNKLTIGEWIDIEYYLTNEDLINILAIIWRRATQSDKWSNKVFEVYDSWSPERTDICLELDTKDVLGSVNELIKWRESVISKYSGLFNIPTDELDETEEEQTISEMILKKQEERASAFSWENLLLSSVNYDFTKVDSLLNMPAILFFNLVSASKVYGKHN